MACPGAAIPAVRERELWNICVSRSSATLAVSMEMRIRRFRNNAWQKIAGTASATPSNVTTSA